MTSKLEKENVLPLAGEKGEHRDCYEFERRKFQLKHRNSCTLNYSIGVQL